MKENTNGNNESLDDKQNAEFKNFLIEADYSSDDVMNAYLLLGAAELDDSVSEAVGLIHAKMQEMSDDGYPINRFIEIANELTQALDNFKNTVEELHLSDQEKALLNSIVSENRSGEIQVHTNGSVSFSLEIEEFESSKKLAIELNTVLLPKLTGMPEDDISVWFEESV